jgi:nitrite reductase (NADH) small subunit
MTTATGTRRGSDMITAENTTTADGTPDTAAGTPAGAAADATAAAPVAPRADTVVEIRTGRGWTAVCRYGALLPGRGVAALVDGRQIALFRDRAGRLYAVGNHDPFSGAHVISRGILGSRGGVPVVASPMYKQAFDLRSGACLDQEQAPDGTPARLPVWPVRLTPAPTAAPTAAPAPPPLGTAPRARRATAAAG